MGCIGSSREAIQAARLCIRVTDAGASYALVFVFNTLENTSRVGRGGERCTKVKEQIGKVSRCNPSS